MGIHEVGALRCQTMILIMLAMFSMSVFQMGTDSGTGKLAINLSLYWCRELEQPNNLGQCNGQSVMVISIKYVTLANCDEERILVLQCAEIDGTLERRSMNYGDILEMAPVYQVKCELSLSCVKTTRCTFQAPMMFMTTTRGASNNHSTAMDGADTSECGLIDYGQLSVKANNAQVWLSMYVSSDWGTATSHLLSVLGALCGHLDVIVANICIYVITAEREMCNLCIKYSITYNAIEHTFLRTAIFCMKWREPFEEEENLSYYQVSLLILECMWLIDVINEDPSEDDNECLMHVIIQNMLDQSLLPNTLGRVLNSLGYVKYIYTMMVLSPMLLLDHADYTGWGYGYVKCTMIVTPLVLSLQTDMYTVMDASCDPKRYTGLLSADSYGKFLLMDVERNTVIKQRYTPKEHSMVSRGSCQGCILKDNYSN